MSRDDSVMTADVRDILKHTVLVRHRLEEQYRDLDQQTATAGLGMWLFLATEVMFFGTLFLALSVYRYLYPHAFEVASSALNWQIGAINTVVLLTSSLTMVLAVHSAQVGNRRRLVTFLHVTALLGLVFLGFKAVEYYIDFRESLVPGVKFEPAHWIANGLAAGQVPHVKLFLIMYWVMTVMHALHMTIGIAVMLVLAWLAKRNYFSATYYSPVDVAGLYWHFVDIVWIFLLPMLYLQGTHHW